MNSLKKRPAGNADWTSNRREFLQVASGAAIYPALDNSVIAEEKTLRVGMVGRDGHPGLILDSLPKVPGTILAAYAKGHPEEDVSSLQKSPVFRTETRVYGNYTEMLEKEPLDLVAVCLPLFQNGQVAIAALKKGIHVIEEKPAALSLEELDRLEETFKVGQRRHTLLLNMRTMPVFQAARRLVSEGWIGEPVLISGQKSYKFGTSRPWYYKERKTYGGTIPWIGIHSIDLMRWISGLEFSAVAATQGNKAHPAYPGCEDHAAMIFQLKNGGTGFCNIDYLRPDSAPTHGDDRIRMAGSAGVLEVFENLGKIFLYSKKGTQEEIPLPPEQDLFTDFIAAIRSGKEQMVPARDGFRTTRIALKAREAADSGKWVAL
jgi:predicted dehydrogenase